MAKRKSNARQLRGAAVTVVIIVAIAVGIILLQFSGSSMPSSDSVPVMTLDPQIAVNLTRIPESIPLVGDAADEINRLKALVDACADYSAERRAQMEQHIAWLLNPATIPGDIIIALGANPPGKLVYGMATYTSIQWRLDERPPDSCLLPIGVMLNDMLTAAGEEPFSIFAGSS